MIKLILKNFLFIGVRKLHIKIEPSEVVRSIAVTEDVTIAKLGLMSKEEALKLSPDETVTIINNEILNIFRVSSKDEIAAMETKDILAKLDAVFKVRVDGQPHVDYPVSILLIRDMVVKRCNRRFGRETIHPTKQFTSMNLLQISCVIA